VGSGDKSLYAIDAGKGLPYWTFTADSPIYSTPAINDSRLYVSSYGGNGTGGTLYSIILPQNPSMEAQISPTASIAPSASAIAPTVRPNASQVPTPSAATQSWCPLPGLAAVLIASVSLFTLWKKH
jgi:hypothetical protein